MKPYRTLSLFPLFLSCVLLFCACKKEETPAKDYTIEAFIKCVEDEYSCVPGSLQDQYYHTIKEEYFDKWMAGLPKVNVSCKTKEDVQGAYLSFYMSYWNSYLSRLTRLEEQYNQVSDQFTVGGGSFFLRYSFRILIDGETEKSFNVAFSPGRKFLYGNEQY